MQLNSRVAGSDVHHIEGCERKQRQQDWELERVEVKEMPQVEHVLLHRKLRFSSFAIAKSDGHFDNFLASAPHHELQPDFIAHRIEGVGALEKGRLL